MASALTFESCGGHPVPRPRGWTSRAARVVLPPAPPMTPAQREALRALVRSPEPARKLSRWERRDRAVDVAWAGVLALLFALCVVAPLADLGAAPPHASALAAGGDGTSGAM